MSADRRDTASPSKAAPGPARVATTDTGVRREKVALSSGCKPRPATAPAGSNRGRHGGDEMSEALG